MNFEILSICAGWFDMAFILENQRIEISASDAWENDSPKYFIKNLVDCLQSDGCVRYVIFDGEPGIYFVIFEKSTDFCVKIYYSDYMGAKLGKEILLYGNQTFESLKRKIKVYKELFNSKINLHHFARCVLRGFEEYLNEEKNYEYINNWGEFPEPEFNALKAAIDKF